MIGGATGSHYTGHAESWWDKLLLIAQLGYLPAELAIKRKVVPVDWSPPAVSEKETYVLERIQRGEI